MCHLFSTFFFSVLSLRRDIIMCVYVYMSLSFDTLNIKETVKRAMSFFRNGYLYKRRCFIYKMVGSFSLYQRRRKTPTTQKKRKKNLAKKETPVYKHTKTTDHRIGQGGRISSVTFIMCFFFSCVCVCVCI